VYQGLGVSVSVGVEVLFAAVICNKQVVLGLGALCSRKEEQYSDKRSPPRCRFVKVHAVFIGSTHHAKGCYSPRILLYMENKFRSQYFHYIFITLIQKARINIAAAKRSAKKLGFPIRDKPSLFQGFLQVKDSPKHHPSTRRANRAAARAASVAMAPFQRPPSNTSSSSPVKAKTKRQRCWPAAQMSGGQSIAPMRCHSVPNLEAVPLSFLTLLGLK
jgi:hypothetical protein